MRDERGSDEERRDERRKDDCGYGTPVVALPPSGFSHLSSLHRSLSYLFIAVFEPGEASGTCVYGKNS
jgi:hypothetical protein